MTLLPKLDRLLPLLPRLGGLLLVVSADAGSGILMAHLWAKVFDPPVAPWVYYTAGVILAVIPPDVDILVQRFTKKRLDSEHRQLFHRPLLFIPLVSVGLGWGVFLWNPDLGPWFWTVLAASVLFLHFVHDSIGEANKWGLAWLAPFSPNLYQLFMGKKPGEQRLLCVWTPEEMMRVKKHTVMEWIDTYYLNLTPEVILSLIWLAITIVVAIYWR